MAKSHKNAASFPGRGFCLVSERRLISEGVGKEIVSGRLSR
jgi:hypothetical protein